MSATGHIAAALTSAACVAFAYTRQPEAAPVVAVLCLAVWLTLTILTEDRSQF